MDKKTVPMVRMKKITAFSSMYHHCSFCGIRGFPLAILILVLLPENRKSDVVITSTEGEPLEMLYSRRTSLVKMDLRTRSGPSVIVDGLRNAVAIDYHFKKDLVVWTDVVDKGIYSVNINGSSKKSITKYRVVTPDGLAVDWIHENIYWTDTGTNTISVASLEGDMRKLLFYSNLDEPRAIVVNPLEGWMFWTDWGNTPKIERSGMDGTHRSTIVSRRIAIPNGLTIDYETRRLFWADVSSHALWSSDYDGSNVKDILFSTSLLGHPFAVDVFQDWLYWTDWRTHSISKVYKVNGSMPQMISSRQHSFPMGLKVYHISKQPKGTSVCGEKNVKCPYLCLPTPKGTATERENFTCACPDGKHCISTNPTTAKSRPVFAYTIFERTTTEAIATASVIESPSQSQLQSNSIEKILQEIQESVYYYGRLVGITFGSLVILIIALLLVGFCLYKPYVQKHISSLNFANPVFGKQTEDQA